MGGLFASPVTLDQPLESPENIKSPNRPTAPHALDMHFMYSHPLQFPQGNHHLIPVLLHVPAPRGVSSHRVQLAAKIRVWEDVEARGAA